MIQCKATEIFPQSGNDQAKHYENMLEVEVEWTLVQGYSFKQVSSTGKRKKHSPR